MYREWAWDAIIVCFVLINYLFNLLFFFFFRVLNNIVELKVVILVFVMFIQYQLVMMMFNKVFLLLKH
jgi:hypothetical protein